MAVHTSTFSLLSSCSCSRSVLASVFGVRRSVFSGRRTRRCTCRDGCDSLRCAGRRQHQSAGTQADWRRRRTATGPALHQRFGASRRSRPGGDLARRPTSPALRRPRSSRAQAARDARDRSRRQRSADATSRAGADDGRFAGTSGNRRQRERAQLTSSPPGVPRAMLPRSCSRDQPHRCRQCRMRCRDQPMYG